MNILWNVRSHLDIQLVETEFMINLVQSPEHIRLHFKQQPPPLPHKTKQQQTKTITTLIEAENMIPKNFITTTQICMKI